MRKRIRNDSTTSTTSRTRRRRQAPQEQEDAVDAPEPEQVLSGSISIPPHPGVSSTSILDARTLYELVNDTKQSEDDEGAICVICQDDIASSTTTTTRICEANCCKTRFHEECFTMFVSASGGKRECCVCKQIFPGGLLGDSPAGEMKWKLEPSSSLPGFPARSGVITIEYTIPGALQTANHPNPGHAFSGTYRLAYLPGTEEGRKVLELLKRAFASRLTFAIGTSLTTGQSNTVIWAGIHHKTCPRGGSFGYPDATYLDRVQEELRSKGIF